jgi:hypothetical protein
VVSALLVSSNQTLLNQLMDQAASHALLVTTKATKQRKIASHALVDTSRLILESPRAVNAKMSVVRAHSKRALLLVIAAAAKEASLRVIQANTAPTILLAHTANVRNARQVRFIFVNF